MVGQCPKSSLRTNNYLAQKETTSGGYETRNMVQADNEIGAST